MGIFDALTGNASHQAAQNTRDAYGAIIPNLALTGQTAFGQAGDALRTGFAGARDKLGTGYDASTGFIKDGSRDAYGFLDGGTGGALTSLQGSRDALTAGGGAFAPMTDLAGRFRLGSSMYADALGLGGPEGAARATEAFQKGPGYTFTLDSGLDAINRRRNAGGMLASGSADADAIKFGTGLADQTYTSWLTNLAPFNNLELSATSGAATGNAGINDRLAGLGVTEAGLLDSAGRTKAGVATGTGNTLSDLARTYFGGAAGLDTGEGAALSANTIGGAQNWQSIYQSALPGWTGTYKQDADADMAASKSIFDTLLGGATLGLKASGIGGFGVPTFGAAKAA